MMQPPPRKTLVRLIARSHQGQPRHAADDIQRQLTLLRKQQDELLNLRLTGEIDAELFGRKGMELRDRIATLDSQLQAADTDRAQQAVLAAKVFELSQGLEQQWLGSKYTEKRQILELVCLNFQMENVSLVPEMRKGSVRQVAHIRSTALLWKSRGSRGRFGRFGF